MDPDTVWGAPISSSALRSPLDPAQSCDSVGGQGPTWPGRRAGQGVDEFGGETIQDGPVTETVALFNAGTGAYHRLGPDHAAVAHDRGRLNDTAAADVAAVDHRAWSDHRVVVDDQFVVGQQMQHRVLQNLYPRADADRAVRVCADDHVAGDLRRVEQQRASADGRSLVTVGVQRPHAFSCLHRPAQDRARVVGQVGLMLAQHRQPLAVGVRGRPDNVWRAPDEDRVGGDHGVRGNQRALAKDAAIAQTRARHEDRTVADLAQVADGGADDRGAVTENGALTNPDRMPGRANYHPVLQYGRVVADAHCCAVCPHDQALRQYRARTDVGLTQKHCGAGDLRLGLVNEKLVEAHGLTVLLAVRASGRSVPTVPAAQCPGPALCG